MLFSVLLTVLCPLFGPTCYGLREWMSMYRFDYGAILAYGNRGWAGDGWSYTDCGKDTDLVWIESMSVSPEPLVPGAKVSVTVNATVFETVEEGAYAAVIVKIGRISIFRTILNICDEARTANASVQCPVQRGFYEVEHSARLPSPIPPAKYYAHVFAFNADHKALACGTFMLDFGILSKADGQFLN